MGQCFTTRGRTVERIWICQGRAPRERAYARELDAELDRICSFMAITRSGGGVSSATPS
jgi:hypothetical protein